MTELERQRAIRQRLIRSGMRERAVLPTGITSIDEAIDGGLPRGLLTELFGAPSSGKTTLALLAAAAVQGSGQSAAWIDAEHAFDPSYAGRMGVRLESLPVAQPDTAEECLEIGRQLCASSAVDLLVIDSAAAMAPELEFEIGLGDGGPGLQARVLASGLRKLAASAARTETAVLVLNQIRGRGDADGEAETSAGGPAVKIYSSVRIAIETAQEGIIRFRVLKNRAARPFTRGEFRLDCGDGVMKTP